LTSDPREQTDLAKNRPILTHYAGSMLRRWLVSPTPATGEPDQPRADQLAPEVERRLRALGYLEEAPTNDTSEEGLPQSSDEATQPRE
jgi:hypothetical protein